MTADYYIDTENKVIDLAKYVDYQMQEDYSLMWSAEELNLSEEELEFIDIFLDDSLGHYLLQLDDEGEMLDE